MVYLKPLWQPRDTLGKWVWWDKKCSATLLWLFELNLGYFWSRWFCFKALMHGEIHSGLWKGGEPLNLVHQFCAVRVRKLHIFFPFSPIQTTCILSPSPFQVSDHCLVFMHVNILISLTVCPDKLYQLWNTILCVGWIDWNINFKVWFDVNYVWKVLIVLRTSCDTGLQVAKKTGASSKELFVLRSYINGRNNF